MKILTALLATSLLSLATSCQSELTARAVPDANLAKDLNYYVVHFTDDNSGVNVDICKQLMATGRSATTGSQEDIPDELDVLVTYIDSWMWDMNMYLLSLDMVFRNAETEVEIASGRSMRTSLIRKDQKWHANALMKEIIKEIYPEEAAAMVDSDD